MSNEKIESISIRIDDRTGKFSLNYNVSSDTAAPCAFEHECFVGLDEGRFVDLSDYISEASAE